MKRRSCETAAFLPILLREFHRAADRKALTPALSRGEREPVWPDRTACARLIPGSLSRGERAGVRVNLWSAGERRGAADGGIHGAMA